MRLSSDGLAAGSAALLIITVNLAGWSLVDQATSTLEREFGRRLVSVGRAMAGGLDPDRIDRLDQDAVAREIIGSQLEQVREQLEVSELFLFDRQDRVVVDARPDRRPWKADYVRLEPEILDAAWNGEGGWTDVRYVEDVPFMDAYVPITGLTGEVRYLLAVEDSPTRLQVFRGFYLTLAGLALLSAAIIVGLALAQAKAWRRLLEARQKAEEADRLSALGQLGATVAHEIRNPLTSLSASVQVVLRRWRKSGRIDEEMLEDLPKEVERVNRIITDFLAFSRQAPIQPARGAPRSFVEAGLRACAPDGSVDGVPVRLLEDTGAPEAANFDADKLRQVLQNLVMNAAQAVGGVGDEGGEVRVTTGGKRRSEWWFEVCDDGPGVPAEDRGRVFEPYFTSKAQGTGLGLAVCRRIVESHGGGLECGEAQGGGARFRATLPLTGRSSG